jgi:lactoylglutathione lyase
MFKRIDAVVLFVEDLERAKAFYRDKVGLKLKSENEGFADFELDNTTVALLERTAAQELITSESVAGGAATGATFQMATFVDDVGRVYEDLMARGVEFLKPPTDQPWGQRTANFQDSEGNVWEISQWMTDQQ